MQKLIGNTILEFAREKKVNGRIKRTVVNRVQKHNDITPLVDKVLNEGNFNYFLNPDAILPLKKFFDGCLMTDHVNTASSMIIAGNSDVVAQAGNDAYAGTFTPRGSFNSVESGLITGGFRNVWDWGTAYGNGTIASVCLCRASVGKTERRANSALTDSASPFETLGSYTFKNQTYDFGFMPIIDYVREKGYYLTYSSGTITIKEYDINTFDIHVLGDTKNACSVTTHTISQSVNNYGSGTSSLSYTGDYIHLLTWSDAGTTLNDYAIKLSDWTCTLTTHTYTGCRFAGWGPSWWGEASKDVMLIRDGYIWATSHSGQKIAKCSMTNDADVTLYDNPAYVCAVAAGSNSVGYGKFFLLPNGDFYIQAPNNYEYTTYYHNGVLYAVRGNQAVTGNSGTTGYQVTDAGLIVQSYVSYSDGIVLLSTYPYVSTVNNLDEAVTKSADLTMKLTYEITEASA